MKKSAIALAVAAALAASGAVQAETTLYGSARVSIDYTDDDGIKKGLIREFPGIDDRAVDGNWDLFNNSSRLGVRGSEDLGGGLSAIYQYEFGVDTTEGGNFNSNRPRVLGLRSEAWGQFSVGTQYTPYYNLVGIQDIFNSSRTFDPTQYLGYVRLDNSVYYTTPSWGGFNLEGMVIIDGDEFNDRTGADKDGIDAWNIAAKFARGPFFIGGTYFKVEGDKADNFESKIDTDQWAVTASYAFGSFNLAATYEQGDSNDFTVVARELAADLAADGLLREVDDDDTRNVILTGEYSFGNNVLRAAYYYTEPDFSVRTTDFFVEVDDQVLLIPGQKFEEDDALQHFTLGFQHNLSKRSRLWVEYLYRNDNDTFDERHIVSVGMRHDF